MPCCKSTASWNTQHLGWPHSHGLRKIFSANSQTQIENKDLPKFLTFFAESFQPLQPWQIWFQRPLQVGAPDFGTISPIILEVVRSMSEGERCHVAWRSWTSGRSVIAPQQQNISENGVSIGLSSWEKTTKNKHSYINQVSKFSESQFPKSRKLAC